MATYDNLPVYKTSYGLLIEIFWFVKEFSKEYKYTLWDKIKVEILDMITCIYRANSNFDNRLLNIKSAREKAEVLRLYIRLCKDLKLLDLKKFVNINLLIESISKQLFSLENSMQK